MLAAGGLKRLSAAVFIAQKMEGEGKDRKPSRGRRRDSKAQAHRAERAGIQEGDANRKGRESPSSSYLQRPAAMT